MTVIWPFHSLSCLLCWQPLILNDQRSETHAFDSLLCLIAAEFLDDEDCRRFLFAAAVVSFKGAAVERIFVQR